MKLQMVGHPMLIAYMGTHSLILRFFWPAPQTLMHYNLLRP
jgi:hypothetical protein